MHALPPPTPLTILPHPSNRSWRGGKGKGVRGRVTKTPTVKVYNHKPRPQEGGAQYPLLYMLFFLWVLKKYIFRNALNMFGNLIVVWLAITCIYVCVRNSVCENGPMCVTVIAWYAHLRIYTYIHKNWSISPLTRKQTPNNWEKNHSSNYENVRESKQQMLN